MLTPATIEGALPFLLACAFKLTVLLASAYVIVFALRHRSSALRHHVWAGRLGRVTGAGFFDHES